jgi:hypothetical protein
MKKKLQCDYIHATIVKVEEALASCQDKEAFHSNSSVEEQSHAVEQKQSVKEALASLVAFPSPFPFQGSDASFPSSSSPSTVEEAHIQDG